MTKYREEIVQGEAAFEAGERRNANPHAYLSTEWYAWDAGWGSAAERAAAEIVTDLCNAGYRPVGLALITFD